MLYDFVVIDHDNKEVNHVLQTIHDKAPARTMSTVKYDNSYFDTFKSLIKTLPEKKEHYLWVCSSICDYSDFDFSYVCDPFAKDQLHVFPSDKQKYGDTFLIDVNKMKELINDMSSLDDYGKINFNQHQRVKRLPAPAFVNSEDTHVNIKEIDIDFPYAVVVTDDNKDLHVDDLEPISLWAPETKNILVTSTGGTRIIVPKEVKNYVRRELYDYPYIKKSSKLAESCPLDIVYLSNGEKSADENYEHLIRITEGIPNRIVRVDGVNGRVQAYHAAAEASQTPWAFTVFAKLKVYHAFDWSWQPDRLQIPKHYIFEAINPINGLIYGHQAMIAYNKKLVLGNRGKGLDFTLDDEHEVVNRLSGTANFNTDEFSTWRTAFRETIKLKAATDTESKERLQIWLSKAAGDFSEYSILGAKDAVSYYETVNGNIDKLKLSYEWVWLKDLFWVITKLNQCQNIMLENIKY